MGGLKKAHYALFGVIIVLSLFIGVRQYWTYKQEKEAEYTKLVETMYEYETYALWLGRAKYYKDFSHANINLLTISLAAYRYYDPSAPSLTIEDIKDFLSDEFYENGELRVLNPPENIDNYIEWFVLRDDGNLSGEYRIFLMHYQREHEEYKNIDIYTTEDIETLNNLIEEFDNCPDKEMYEF